MTSNDRATPNQLWVAAVYDQAHGEALTRCANQLRAAVELIGPADMTPAAQSILHRIADEWDRSVNVTDEPCPDCVPRPFSSTPLCPTHQAADDQRKATP